MNPPPKLRASNNLLLFKPSELLDLLASNSIDSLTAFGLIKIVPISGKNHP